MIVSNSEKLALIGTMIGDFWEYNTEAQRVTGAEAFITAISTVVDFKPPKEEK